MVREDLSPQTLSRVYVCIFPPASFFLIKYENLVSIKINEDKPFRVDFAAPKRGYYVTHFFLLEGKITTNKCTSKKATKTKTVS
jgi:hypothetical protein